MRALTPATYTLFAYAYDALGNWTRTELTAVVQAAARVMTVDRITLGGPVRRGVASIMGDVYVVEAGRALSNATVSVRWTRPGGNTRTASACTNNSGRAAFSTSGSAGTYTLTVTGVARQGYVFDAAGSVPSRSITR